MKELPVVKSSQLASTAIRTLLAATRVPMRLACNDSAGFPLVCSLWFTCAEDAGETVLWCASHESSHLVKVLLANNKVGFDIGVNTPPYKGVRGQGTASLVREGAAEILTTLLHRYDIGSDSSLGQWLLSRVDGEFAIRIAIKRISAWDYTRRMAATS